MRGWIPAGHLAGLAARPEVQLVDITPQAVRDRLARSPWWGSYPINDLSMEIPVWNVGW